MSGLQKRALEAAKTELQKIYPYNTYSALRKALIESGVEDKVFSAAWDKTSDVRDFDFDRVKSAIGWLDVLLEESK